MIETWRKREQEAIKRGFIIEEENSETPSEKNEIEWKLVGPDEECVSDVIEDLKKTGTEIQLVSKIHIDPSALLTARQELIMEVAFKRGYFEYPKRIKMEELANIFEVSRSTISEIMRKGQQRIIGNYFDDASG